MLIHLKNMGASATSHPRIGSTVMLSMNGKSGLTLGAKGDDGHGLRGL
jgi:hypothetical protein